MNRMTQLIGFVEVERLNNPGKTHIAEWALSEIELLHEAFLAACTVIDDYVGDPPRAAYAKFCELREKVQPKA